MKAGLYRLAEIEERQIDVQRFKVDMMRVVMKMNLKKAVQHRILAVKHFPVDYARSKSSLNQRGKTRGKAGSRVTEKSWLMVLLGQGSCRSISAVFNRRTRDSKPSSLEALSAAEMGREMVE